MPVLTRKAHNRAADEYDAPKLSGDDADFADAFVARLQQVANDMDRLGFYYVEDYNKYLETH